MWHGYAVTSSTLSADPPSNETIDVFYNKRVNAHRRRYQCTTGSTALKEQRKEQSPLPCSTKFFIAIAASMVFFCKVHLVIIYMDSRVSLDSLSNPKNHAFLVEKIRKNVANLESKDWKIKFSWVKAHAGNYGNETADRLAKEAARSQ